MNELKEKPKRPRTAAQVAAWKFSWVTLAITGVLLIVAFSAANRNDQANMNYIIGISNTPASSSETAPKWVATGIFALLTIGLRTYSNAAPEGRREGGE